MAGIKDFKKVANANEDVSKLQERLQEFFTPLIANPMLDGVLLTGITVGTSPTKIEHKLRRQIQGWVVVRNNTNCTVWEPSRELNTAFVTLQSSAATTVDLWVF